MLNEYQEYETTHHLEPSEQNAESRTQDHCMSPQQAPFGKLALQNEYCNCKSRIDSHPWLHHHTSYRIGKI